MQKTDGEQAKKRAVWKCVEVQPDTHHKLLVLKYKWGYKRVDDVVKKLLELVEKEIQR